MSELTRCNFCTLTDLEREHGAANVSLKREGGWLQVYVNGAQIGVLFLAIGDRCSC